ncbi:MAG: ABC transporter permease [Planctomycetaceae bacterium]|nr:ABC transporter permease [Planctomycetaceae bacterium]
MVAFTGVVLFVYRTRDGIIARATTKEAVRQPVFILLMALSLLLLVVNTVLPFFSLGDDIKMLKDCGLATILISGLLLAVWTSSTSIANEIEGKTAMTLLSKPINRRQFIIGKYVGIMQAVFLLMAPLVVVFFLLLMYKVGYDAREASKEVPEWFDSERSAFNAERLDAALQILPAMLLAYMEVAVMAAVSVAISTRLPMVVNIVSCLAIFVIGHLTPVLVQVKVDGLEPVQFVARLVATVLPALANFDVQAAVATGSMVPPTYVLIATGYCVVYCSAAVLLAFVLFEDRDLA